MRRFQSHLPPLFMLLALTVLAYHEVPGHSFLANWDDQVYVTGNQAVRGFSLQHLRMACTGYYVGNHAPVQIISYMLDYTLWGLNPFGFLLANVVYQVICTILLYLLLQRHGFQKLAALFGAALFLVHPVQMESVAWVSQRKNLLAMLFLLLAWHAWLSYRRRDDTAAWKWYASSVLLFVLALLSKSVAVIFPVMLVMHDLLVPPVRLRPREHLDKIPFLAAAVAVGLLALVTQSPEHGGGRVAYPDNLLSIPLTMLPVLARYLGILFWPAPAGLSVMYYPPFRNGIDGAVLGAMGLATALFLLGAYLYRKDRPGLFWYLLFFLGLVPVSQIVPLVTLMNDRYLYFPMLGVAGLAAALITACREWGACLRKWSVPAAAGLVVLLALSCHQRGRVWKDTVSLFSDAVEKVPDHPDPWSRLAEGYVYRGDLATAKIHYEKGASKGALDHEAQYNFARIFLETGDYATAYELIWKLLLTDSRTGDGQLLLGEYYYRTGDYAEAVRQLGTFLDRAPDSVHGLLVLGQAYLMMLNLDGARSALGASLEKGGDSPQLWYALARLEALQGHRELALAHLEAAVQRGLSLANFRDGEHQLEPLHQDARYLRVTGLYQAPKKQ